MPFRANVSVVVTVKPMISLCQSLWYSRHLASCYLARFCVQNQTFSHLPVPAMIGTPSLTYSEPKTRSGKVGHLSSKLDLSEVFLNT